MLVAKYKGIRFLDEDVNEGTYYRIRSDQFTWIGKTRGGWLAHLRRDALEWPL